MGCIPESYRCSLGEHWRRQIGDVYPSTFARQIGGCEDLVRRLVRFAELDGHAGCVNTVTFSPSGELLVSGSDDKEIILWNWASKTQVLSYDSGHQSNVFQARIMPYADDRTIVSCAADGQVRYGTMLQDGTVSTKKLARHRGRAHKLALEPGSSRIFYSSGEDGVVQHFDLREEKSTKLLTCHQYRASTGKPCRKRTVQLNAIVMNPRNLNYFAVGGSDQYARVYDIRRVHANTFELEDQPVETYAPKHLQGPGHDEHITCVAYSHQEELLVTYNDELIYLFDKSMSLGSSPHRNAEDSENEKEDEKEKEDETEEVVGPHQEAPKPQVYEGHRNHKTVKGVNFFGPNSEYVVSGSDCGRIFIWRKKGGKLVAMMRGDDSVVNCLEPHPHATILATSGIDETVKVWAPISERLNDLPEDADKIMNHNKRRRENHASNVPLTPSLVRTLLLSRHLQVPNDDEGGTYTRVSFEGSFGDDDDDEAGDDTGLGDDDDDDDDDSSEDGGPGNSRECIIS